IALDALREAIVAELARMADRRVLAAPKAAAAPRDTDTALPALIQYLRSGTLMAGTGARSQVELLDRLLAQPQPGEALWATLSDALARPDSARRLLAGPPRQLRAIVRRSAPAQADAMLALAGEFEQLGREERFPGVGGEQLMRLCWQILLKAATARPVASISIAALRAVIHAELAQLARTPEQPARPAGEARDDHDAQLRQLAAFLETGRMPAGASLAPATLLERLLARPTDRLWAVLARA
ncbi:MAG: hypothetical protein ACLGI6_23350, partial [Gammaproteobacteria bacterium]